MSGVDSYRTENLRFHDSGVVVSTFLLLLMHLSGRTQGTLRSWRAYSYQPTVFLKAVMMAVPREPEPEEDDAQGTQTDVT
jgi:hypothetical protein